MHLPRLSATMAIVTAAASPAIACGTLNVTGRSNQKRELRPPGSDPVKTLRILNPYPGIYAYYDGRTGDRLQSDGPNWLDDGAFTLGVATYSIVSGDSALLYDAAITEAHARAMMDHVRGLGVSKTITVYSHFHFDHVAGAPALEAANSTFAGHAITARIMASDPDRFANADPPVRPVPPTTTYEDALTVRFGNRSVELHHFHVHTADGTVLYLPEERLLFAGDTLEDTATFISEPDQLDTHVAELNRMATQLPAAKILPAHGSPDRIAAGGYEPEFIRATLRYIAAVNEPVETPAAWGQTLQDVVKSDVDAGNLIYFAQYEDVHQANVNSIRDARAAAAAA